MAKTIRPVKVRIKFDLIKVRKCVLILRALNHKLRQRILDLLEEYDQLTVTDIYVKLRIEQSVASQHLSILRKAGVVATDRQGKFIYYSLDRDEMQRIQTFITGLVGGPKSQKHNLRGPSRQPRDGFFILQNMFKTV